jgi:tetratricopeptide (TPR) repeat protein
MRGKALAIDIRQKENATQAVSLFQRALLLDPDNVDALVGIASTCIFQLLNQYRTDERKRLLDEAEGLISRAFALAPDHIGVLKARAVLLRARGRFDEALVATRAVIGRNPGEPTAYREMGLNKLYLGETPEAAEWFRRADRVAPSDPMRWTWLQGLGRALMQMGQDAEAVTVMRLVIDSNPGWLRGKALLAASEALAGNVEVAKQHLSEFAESNPDVTISRFSDERASIPLAAVSPVYRRENERILDGLRRAGMPD